VISCFVHKDADMFEAHGGDSRAMRLILGMQTLMVSGELRREVVCGQEFLWVALKIRSVLTI